MNYKEAMEKGFGGIPLDQNYTYGNATVTKKSSSILLNFYESIFTQEPKMLECIKLMRQYMSYDITKEDAYNVEYECFKPMVKKTYETIKEYSDDEDKELAIVALCGSLVGTVDYAYAGSIPDEMEISELPELTENQYPIFTHIVNDGDIDDDYVSECISLYGLKEEFKNYTSKILERFKHYLNDEVTVSLFDKTEDGYVEKEIRLNIKEEYEKYMAYGSHVALWPGLLISAFEEMGLDVFLMTRDDIIETLFGPDAKNTASSLEFDDFGDTSDEEETQDANSIVTTEVLKSYSKCIAGIYLACTKGRRLFKTAAPELKEKADAFYSSIVDLVAYACFAYMIDIGILAEPIGYAMNKMHDLRDYLDENGVDVGEDYRNTMDIVEDLFDCTREESAYRTDPYRHYVDNFANILAIKIATKRGYGNDAEVIARSEYRLRTSETFERSLDRKPIVMLFRPTELQLNEYIREHKL